MIADSEACGDYCCGPKVFSRPLHSVKMRGVDNKLFWATINQGRLHKVAALPLHPIIFDQIAYDPGSEIRESYFLDSVFRRFQQKDTARAFDVLGVTARLPVLRTLRNTTDFFFRYGRTAAALI